MPLIEKSDQVIILADKYYNKTKNQNIKKLCTAIKIIGLVVLHKWDEIKQTVDLIDYSKSPKSHIIGYYIFSILELYVCEQIENADYMLSKIVKRGYAEENLALAIFDYHHDGDKQEIKKILVSLLSTITDKRYQGFLYFYLGRLSDGNNAFQYYQKASELGDLLIKHKAKSILKCDNKIT